MFSTPFSQQSSLEQQNPLEIYINRLDSISVSEPQDFLKIFNKVHAETQALLKTNSLSFTMTDKLLGKFESIALNEKARALFASDKTLLDKFTSHYYACCEYIAKNCEAESHSAFLDIPDDDLKNLNQAGDNYKKSVQLLNSLSDLVVIKLLKSFIQYKSFPHAMLAIQRWITIAGFSLEKRDWNSANAFSGTINKSVLSDFFKENSGFKLTALHQNLRNYLALLMDEGRQDFANLFYLMFDGIPFLGMFQQRQEKTKLFATSEEYTFKVLANLKRINEQIPRKNSIMHVVLANFSIENEINELIKSVGGYDEIFIKIDQAKLLPYQEESLKNNIKDFKEGTTEKKLNDAMKVYQNACQKYELIKSVESYTAEYDKLPQSLRTLCQDNNPDYLACKEQFQKKLKDLDAEFNRTMVEVNENGISIFTEIESEYQTFSNDWKQRVKNYETSDDVKRREAALERFGNEMKQAREIKRTKIETMAKKKKIADFDAFIPNISLAPVYKIAFMNAKEKLKAELPAEDEKEKCLKNLNTAKEDYELTLKECLSFFTLYLKPDVSANKKDNIIKDTHKKIKDMHKKDKLLKTNNLEEAQKILSQNLEDVLATETMQAYITVAKIRDSLGAEIRAETDRCKADSKANAALDKISPIINGIFSERQKLGNYLIILELLAKLLINDSKAIAIFKDKLDFSYDQNVHKDQLSILYHRVRPILILENILQQLESKISINDKKLYLIQQIKNFEKIFSTEQYQSLTELKEIYKQIERIVLRTNSPRLTRTSSIKLFDKPISLQPAGYVKTPAAVGAVLPPQMHK